MSETEIAEFRPNRGLGAGGGSCDCIDDLGKVQGLEVPELDGYRERLLQVVEQAAAAA